jgi:polyisoprenoid-binding protein YceI
MKGKLLVAILGITLAAPSLAADAYTIDPNHTHPSYEISHSGWSVQRGRFDKVSGKIVLDRAAKSGSVDVTIDAASVSTGVPRLDEHLKSEDFFNVAKYPSVIFKSKKVVFNGDKPVSVDGEITLLGVTKPLTLVVSAFQCAPNQYLKKEVCGADATGAIKRTEFGMSKFAPGLGDDVRLVINVEAIKD